MKYILIATCLISIGCSSSRNLSDWSFLGERTVNHAVDRDEVRVGARDGSFSKIKMVVRRRAVDFRALKVHYANGGVEDIALRRTIPAGGESRVIDLNGRNRVIEKIVFVYNTDRKRGARAIVRVYGKH